VCFRCTFYHNITGVKIIIQIIDLWQVLIEQLDLMATGNCEQEELTFHTDSGGGGTDIPQRFRRLSKIRSIITKTASIRLVVPIVSTWQKVGHTSYGKKDQTWALMDPNMTCPSKDSC
jgi:hypothetical protein